MSAFVPGDSCVSLLKLQLFPTIKNIWALRPDLIVLAMIDTGRISDNQRMGVSDSVAVKWFGKQIGAMPVQEGAVGVR